MSSSVLFESSVGQRLMGGFCIWQGPLVESEEAKASENQQCVSLRIRGFLLVLVSPASYSVVETRPPCGLEPRVVACCPSTFVFSPVLFPSLFSALGSQVL